MTKDEKINLKGWLTRADHDIIAAQSLFDHRPDILDTVCFHCQQAVEKYLKGYLIFKGNEITKTHNLTCLQTECAGFDKEFDSLDFRNLNYFAVETRYADDLAAPPTSEVEYYLELAGKVKAMVLRKISPSL